MYNFFLKIQLFIILLYTKYSEAHGACRTSVKKAKIYFMFLYLMWHGAKHDLLRKYVQLVS